MFDWFRTILPNNVKADTSEVASVNSVVATTKPDAADRQLLLVTSPGTGACGDVLFIHGLDGDARTTWQQPDDPDSFWPALLGKDLPCFNVWSIGYEVSSSAWKGGTMPLVDRATNVLSLLEANDIGARPMVFICHSLGGLLIKQMLRHAVSYGNPAWTTILQNTRGVVFLSTPHSGSDLATWLHYMSLLLPSVSIQELQSQAPQLRDLNTWYRNTIGHGHLAIPTRVFYEKKRTKGLLVVDDGSADPGIAGVYPVPLDEDHVSICKPSSTDGTLYKLVKSFVEQNITPSLAGTDRESRDAKTRDAARIKSYFVVFDRGVFKVPCVFEGALYWIDKALSDVSAAMGVGSVFSRDGKLVKEIPPISDFETEFFRLELEKARASISDIRVTLYELDRHIAAAQGDRESKELLEPGESESSAGVLKERFYHMEFTLVDMISTGASQTFIRQAFEIMDQVDAGRNDLIQRLNKLFAAANLQHSLPLITLSSEQLRLSAHKLRQYDWGNYYLRTHAILLPFLETGQVPKGAQAD